MSNPCLYPLIYGCDRADVPVVHVNPLERKHMPHAAAEIVNRINWFNFNSSLMREMRAIHFLTGLIDRGEIKSKSMKRVLMHSVAANEVMNELGHTSELNADWEFPACAT